MSVCLSVYHTEFKLLLLFLFLDGIEPYFGHQFSMTPSTNSRSSIFDLSPLTPKIYSPILVAITLHFSGHIFVTSWTIHEIFLHQTGGLGERPIQRNHAKCCGADPCCHGNEIWARRGDPSPTGLMVIVVIAAVAASFGFV